MQRPAVSFLEVEDVNEPVDLFTQAVVVALTHPTDNLDVEFDIACSEGEMPPQGAPVWKKEFGELFVDYGDLRRRRPIRGCELAPRKQGNLHGVEVLRADGIDGALHVFVFVCAIAFDRNIPRAVRAVERPATRGADGGHAGQSCEPPLQVLEEREAAFLAVAVQQRIDAKVARFSASNPGFLVSR